MGEMMPTDTDLPIKVLLYLELIQHFASLSADHDSQSRLGQMFETQVAVCLENIHEEMKNVKE